MKRLCLTVIICAIFVFVRANVSESNGVMYDIIDSETLSVQVVPYLDENGESLYGYIVYIPATVKHNNDVYHVVRIGDHAFKGAENLYAIVMENGIECIGNEAFSGCTALRGITLTQSVREIGEKAFFGSALENITFRSASCPSLLGQDVFTSPENLRICFPASSMDNYRSVLGSIIEDKKQISFVNAESDGFLFNDMVFCSPGDASPTDNGEITIDWQSIAQGSRFDINMVIYVPAEDKIAILRPMLYGMGIGFSLNHDNVGAYYVNCPDESMISKMGAPYSGIGNDGLIWIFDKISDDTVVDCFYLSGVEEIDTDSDGKTEYFNIQGVHVDNPAVGDIVIEKRAGKSVRKIYR